LVLAPQTFKLPLDDVHLVAVIFKQAIFSPNSVFNEFAFSGLLHSFPKHLDPLR